MDTNKSIRIKIILLDKQKQDVKALIVDSDRVFEATIIIHEATHYAYHRMVNFGCVEFIQCHPPVEI